jgi:AIG2-like family
MRITEQSPCHSAVTIASSHDTHARLPLSCAPVGLYAAFGTNMDPSQMLERCPHSPAAGVGWLDGWRLTFGGEEIGWEGAMAMIVEQPGSQVFVALYDLSPHDHEALDRWEGAETGLCRKIHVRVSTLDDDVLAFVYLLDGYEGGLPSARYLSLVAGAAEAAGAPDEYVAELRARPFRTIGD